VGKKIGTLETFILSKKALKSNSDEWPSERAYLSLRTTRTERDEKKLSKMKTIQIVPM